MKYRKKPIVIEAIQYNGKNYSEIKKLSKSREIVQPPVLEPSKRNPSGEYLQIKTLEGVMTASNGDWIIKGVSGEIYPCKPDIFKKTYEAVE